MTDETPTPQSPEPQGNDTPQPEEQPSVEQQSDAGQASAEQSTADTQAQAPADDTAGASQETPEGADQQGEPSAEGAQEQSASQSDQPRRDRRSPERGGDARSLGQRGERGGKGGSGGGKGGRGNFEDEGDGFEESVVKVYRCSTVVKGGRRFSFAALVVVGDRKGRVGIGYGKANEVPPAVEKALKDAHKNLVTVNLAGATIPHQVVGQYGASKILLRPANPGTGVIAGGSARSVIELAGVHDVLTKSYGSTSPKNLVKATLNALTTLRSAEEISNLRGVAIG